MKVISAISHEMTFDFVMFPGVPGVAQRFMAAMEAAAVSVLMITQASSEHSLCVAVPEDQGALYVPCIACALDIWCRA